MAKGKMTDLLADPEVTKGCCPTCGQTLPKKSASTEQVLIWFNDFWIHFPSDFGNKGSKPKAQSEFIKLRPDAAMFEAIMEGLRNQIVHKRQQEQNGQFVEPFQHVERFLKYRRWEDEISQRPAGQRSTDKAGLAAEAAFGRNRSTVGTSYHHVIEDGAAGEISGRIQDVESGTV